MNQTQMSNLREVYRLANELRAAIAQALQDDPKLHYGKTLFYRHMKAIQYVAEWALGNMTPASSTPEEESERL